MTTQPNVISTGTARRLFVELFDAAHDEHTAQVRQVEVIAELIENYDTLDPQLLPGAEMLKPAGADGTPMVAEFLAAELQGVLGVSDATAWHLIRDTANLKYRHPLLWDAIRAGRLRVWQAREIVRRVAAAKLDAAAAGWVDQHLDPYLGRLVWGRLLSRLQGLIVRADHVLAARRADQAREERFVRVRHDGEGMSTIIARTDTATAVIFDATLSAIALAKQQDQPDAKLDALKSDALADYVSGVIETGQVARPQATIVLHLNPDDPTVARTESLGPLLQGQYRELLGHARITVQPVIDLNGDPSADSYEIPTRIRRHLRWREPFEVFPFSSRSARHNDLDHTTPFQHGPNAPPGQTRASNLGPLSRYHHRAKTHGGWRVTQPQPGTYHWTSPLGFRYLVNRTGTTRLEADLTWH